jgi:putative membrane protein
MEAIMHLPPLLATTWLPLAQSFEGHHDWDGGWWILMGAGMLVFWGLVIAGGVWLARELSARRTARPSTPSALEVLDHRFADGTISVEEYDERRRAILDAHRERRDTDG